MVYSDRCLYCIPFFLIHFIHQNTDTITFNSVISIHKCQIFCLTIIYRYLSLSCQSFFTNKYPRALIFRYNFCLISTCINYKDIINPISFYIPNTSFNIVFFIIGTYTYCYFCQHNITRLLNYKYNLPMC